MKPSSVLHLMPVLFTLVLLVIRRHDAAAWLLDLIGGPLPRWQMASLGWLFLVEVAIVCSVVCVLILLWNWARHEVPADERRKTRP
jgi:hypothetical protein